MKAAQCEELNDITLTENLGIEVIVAALKSDIHQVNMIYSKKSQIATKLRVFHNCKFSVNFK